jgi:pseudouridine synthase
MEKMRLQKYLAQCGVASRRKSEVLITDGLVRVNGKTVTELGTQIDPSTDRIEVNGTLLNQELQGILLLNKPKHVVTTKHDPQNRTTVMNYLDKKYQTYFPVGRLDFDTTGLVIMTNDGELADYLTHPRYEIKRTYQALVKGQVNENLPAKAKKGVTLEDGFVNAELKILSKSPTNSKVEIILHIGKKHIVKRFLDALGHPVLELCRTAHGPFKLGTLQNGQTKVLDNQEYKRIKKKLFQSNSDS